MPRKGRKLILMKPAPAFDAVIFDIDNVLVDTRPSYLEAIRWTIDIYLTNSTVPFFRMQKKSRDPQILSLVSVEQFKLLVGFNDDWDCCYGLLIYLLSLPVKTRTVERLRKTVDLKAFSGNASSFLGDAAIPVGDYNGIRITVTSATATLASNGTTVPVKVPSGALRIKGHFSVVAGKETDLTLDFNLARSVVQKGNGEYVLKPVLRLAASERGEAGEQERREREARRDDEDRGAREHRGGHDE